MFWTGELIARTAPVRRRPGPAHAPHVDRGMAAYLGLAIGDALGATVEFLTPNEIRQQIGVHSDITGGGWLRLKAGKVTDDTTMSLALGASIIARGRVDALAAAEAFDAWMRAKPVDIGNTVRRNLIGFRQTGNPEAAASEHDAGNGAAMRVLPVALACYGQPEKTTIFANRAQAHVTHHNALSDAACEALIFMVQDFLAGRDPVEVERRRAGKLVSDFPVFAYDKRHRDNPSGFVVDTMQAVLQSFFATETFEDCLIDVVNRGIPRRWLKALDENIAAQCPEQARTLLTLAGHP
ncbi:MAG: ADP-ribosyl-[dinitrogen reductase] hydrolase [Betaproteobacteria bacterium HGW-Betaproteobacteria-6]|nr:MAG: ADP-ribosyl-[dinitrogen reductase] hydrolase [Betaproteobacteria bacterium HGW-Betaproteobacteria-6]